MMPRGSATSKFVGRDSLRADGVSAATTAVMAIAGSAPAYSVAAVSATLIATAGLGSAAALLWCAIPMLGIAWAFAYLGRADASAGAAYSWVGRVLHPILGFFSGWALVVSATIFMVAGALPAGVVSVGLFAPDEVDNVPLVAAVGAAWFLAMATFVLVGVRISARAQWIMTGIEVVILVAFAVVALTKASGGNFAGSAFSWSWFSLGSINGGTGAFVAAALVAAFYYWGWDVSANLSEETHNGRRNSGLAGIIGVISVFVIFTIFTITIQVVLPAEVIEQSGGNILGVLGESIWPGIGGKILVTAVLLSTVASIETTLIQVTRTLFAMGRDHTIPRAFGRTHRQWKTPVFATVAVTGVCVVLFVGSAFFDSVGDLLGNVISSIGLQMSFYYSLAGAAVVVAYRLFIFSSVKNFIFIGLWPALGAAFMLWVFCVSIPALPPIVRVIGLGSLALGFIPIALYWKKGALYFHRRTIEVPNDAVPDVAEREQSSRQ